MLSCLSWDNREFLAAIKWSRINLAELPLPNAKSWLFGHDFPSLASKQAELSRGVTKNVAQTTGTSFPRLSNSSQSQSRPRGDTFNKYQSTGFSNPSKSQSNYLGSRSQKTGFFVPLARRDVSQTLRVHSVLENLTSDPQILSIVSGYKIVFLKIPFEKSPPFTQASGQEAFLI